MGYFLNNIKKNNQFVKETRGEYFVDKSGLIEKMNKLVGTASQYVCITRPRRFGKTTNLLMLASYYSKGASFKDVFDKLEISQSKTYLEHLNKHNVIYINFSEVPSKNGFTYEEYMDRFEIFIREDLKAICPDLKIIPQMELYDIFDQVYGRTEEGFVFIIDEWDYIFNKNLFTKDERDAFLGFLMDLLKDKTYVDLVYITGILPIAKCLSESTLNTFKEYTMIEDKIYDKYFGFTEDEVEELCKRQEEVSLNELKEWYNGYKTHDGIDLYNPRSVIYALEDGVCRSYWTNTGSMNEIIPFINMNIDGSKDDIIEMISGIKIKIALEEYTAEKVSFVTKDQLFSAMVNYGFLSYYNNMLSIPNRELQLKFDKALKASANGGLEEIINNSAKMLEATLNRDTKKMEEIIQAAHDFNIPLLKYNDENSLSCVVTLVYLLARNDYNIKREERAGAGLADFVFRPYNRSQPAFILELKKDSTPEDAIRQIRKRRYVEALDDCTGEKFAVGIVYDSKNKNHKIKIENL